MGSGSSLRAQRDRDGGGTGLVEGGEGELEWGNILPEGWRDFPTVGSKVYGYRQYWILLTTPGQEPNCHKIQYITESDKAALPEYDNGNR